MPTQTTPPEKAEAQQMALAITKLESLHEGLPIPTLADAVRALAGFDSDGATVRNDVGFNKLDTVFGRKMATIPMERWTYRQANAVYQMLRKYRSQLQRNWSIDYSAIAAPDADSWTNSFTAIEKIVRTVDLQPGENQSMQFVLTFDRNPALLATLRQIPGLRWDKEHSTQNKSVWYCKASAEAAEIIAEVALERDFSCTAAASARLDQLTRGFRQALEASNVAAADPIEGVLEKLGDIQPYPFQWAGARYILEHANNHGFIGDERGVGKTLQALIALEAADAYPALVVTPNNVKFKWMREIARALPHRKALMVRGNDLGARDRADIYVTNWESLSDGWDPKAFGKRVVLLKPSIERISARGLRGYVLDESHKAKNPGAQRTVAAKNIADDMRRNAAVKGFNPLIVNLTGTTVQNRVDELWPQIEIVGRGDDFGGYWGFMKKFGRYNVSMRNRPPDEMPELQELHALLRGTCMVRRLKKDVFSEMPELTRSMLPMEIDNRDEYQRAQENAARWFGERAARDAEFLLSIAHLSDDEQQEAKRVRAMDAEIRASRGRAFIVIQALKNVAVKGKMASVKEWSQEFLDEGSKGLVVFADHRNVQDELSTFFGAEDPALILGGMNAELKDAENLRFQAKETRVAVCSMKSSSEGIDLTAASDLLCVELGWNPGHHTQVEGRIDRNGQTEPCTAYYPVALDTIEEDIFELIWRSKARVVGTVLDGAEYETFQGRGPESTDGEADEGILNTLAKRLAGMASRKRWITREESEAIAKAKVLDQVDDVVEGEFTEVIPDAPLTNGIAHPELPAPAFTTFTEEDESEDLELQDPDERNVVEAEEDDEDEFVIQF